MSHQLQEYVSNDSYLMNLDHFAVCYDFLDKEVAEVRGHCCEVTLHINCLPLVLAAVVVTADSKSRVLTPTSSSPTRRRVAAGRGARLAP
jgi:hypothetical protein